MTRRELYRWIINKPGIAQKHLPENSIAFAIVFENKKNGRSAMLNTPIDDREMLPETIIKICIDLGIDWPSGLIRQED